jgi:hypothetical protein
MTFTPSAKRFGEPCLFQTNSRTERGASTTHRQPACILFGESGHYQQKSGILALPTKTTVSEGVRRKIVQCAKTDEHVT